LFLLLLALFPIAIYCVVLAALNRRDQPSLANGSWDFLGMLFGASGVLLFALPRMLFEIFDKILKEQPFAEGGPSGEAASSVVLVQAVAWGIWWAMVVGGAVLLIWLRRSKTVVYNIAPTEFERAFEQALERLKLAGTRRGVRILIAPFRPLEEVPEPDASAITAAPELLIAKPVPTLRAVPPSGEAVVEMEVFPLLYNVTLHWRDVTPELRQEIELELARELREVRTDDNPAGSWFLGVAGFLFALMFLVVMVLLFGVVLPPRR
jgi:hypothetical protein